LSLGTVILALMVPPTEFDASAIEPTARRSPTS